LFTQTVDTILLLHSGCRVVHHKVKILVQC
jgi:hypothetical protein